MEFGTYYKKLRESSTSGTKTASRIRSERDRVVVRNLTASYREIWCPAEREVWERAAFLLLDSGMSQIDTMRLTAVAARSMSPEYIKGSTLTTYEYIQNIRKTNIWTGFGLIGTSKFGIGGSYTAKDMTKFISDLFIYMLAVSYVFDMPVNCPRLSSYDFRNWVSNVALELSTSEKQFVEYVNAFEALPADGLPPKYDISNNKHDANGKDKDVAGLPAILEDGSVSELSLRDLTQMKNINEWTEEEFGAELTSLYLAMASKQNHKGMLDVLNIKAKIMGLFKETDVGGNTFNTLVLLQNQTESALESMGYVKRKNEV